MMSAMRAIARFSMVALVALSGCGGSGDGDETMVADAVDAVVDGDVDVMDTGSDATVGPDASDTDTVTSAGVTVRMDFTRAEGFWTAPWPEVSRQSATGTDVDGFRHRNNSLVTALLEMVSATDGVATTSTIFLPLTGAVVPASLPDLRGSIEATGSVLLTRIDGGPGTGVRHPVEVRFVADGGPYAGDDLLAVQPLQGMPLAPGSLYAAVVTTAVRDDDGEPLVVAPELATLDGLDPDDADDYRAALEALDTMDVSGDTVAGLAVFRTGEPTAELQAVVEAMRGEVLPEPLVPWTALEVHDDFCVFQTEIELPVYQGGDPPYTSQGGGWVFDAAGAPVRQRVARSRVFVTVPRTAMPEAGFPPAVFVRTGGGGDRPLIDRGVRAEPGGPAIEPGTGLARELARAGVAGLSVDGPHGGLRNVTGGDEQFLMFNVTNPLALRDNVRQSAAELVRFADIVEGLELDASSCPGLSTPDGDGLVHFDLAHLALLGHSMGATISPLVLATEPRYRAVVLSGAGGSWIANIVYKESPVAVRPAAELLLGYDPGQMHTHDPVLALFQWAVESADPPVYGQAAAQDRQVLMVQGIVDTYILPPIANATTLSMGLDVAGAVLDAEVAALSAFDSIGDLVDLSGAELLGLPVRGNAAAGAATAVVVQHAEGPIEDGHEVMFQLAAPRHQVRCFFETWLADGVATVPVAVDDPTAACR